jgi:hypothetical protein
LAVLAIRTHKMSPIPLAGMQPVVVEIADFLCPEVDEVGNQIARLRS